MGNVFNPFGKEFKIITEEDLEILKTVAEGWYVEYKERKLDGKKIAKSISSFANSHGGIYFIGIEADGSNNCAKNIIGVDDSPDIIRDSVSGNLQPFPFFETHVIQLKNGKKILMAVVASGENPPYINSDGRIYRRQEAASDPIAENNRYSIDELYKKAQKYKEILENFRTFDFGTCNAESESPYLEIFINTKPFRHFFVDNLFGKDNLNSVLNQFKEGYTVEEKISGTNISFSGSIKLDTINTYADSISLRLLEGADLAYNGTTIILDVFGNAKGLFPLNEKNNFTAELSERYIKVLNRSRSDSTYILRFLDARTLIGAIFCLFTKYGNYLEKNNYKGEIEIKIRLKNCFRKTLYIDGEKFITHVEANGIPICMKDEQYFPLYPITLKVSELKQQPIMSCLTVFSHIANALGIPADVAFLALIEEMHKTSQPESR